MAGSSSKKRSQDDKSTRPTKKQRQIEAYHSGSDSDDGADDRDDFDAVNLMDSDDEDIHNAELDDVAPSDEDAGSGAESASEAEEGQGEEADSSKPRQRKTLRPQKEAFAKDAPDSEASTTDGDSSDSDRPRHKSKRNDPAAFATSLSKILNTKLSTSRRADPVLARSAEAQEASRRVVDTALETKARRRMREAKRLAMEKGRVRDVLIAGSGSTKQLNIITGDVEEVEDGKQKKETTQEILETERRLRKVAQRGVVKLFNAVRAAQVKASEAENRARNEGVVGVKRREEKVTEMSRKGFLDLIASGGGKLKKGALEEA
ncbi:Rrp15p-domain-containing protein [Coniochaeta hoffmannii]|uniref:Rrp15p-domain-containing protein n=1 Tax=Coniochaeta hoffmannii TaxID=91930 RepID=A0AA38RXR4_9PEZI|nr:Rrp15p-domain-containing protein [Coniochaeta hoffmannii]